MLPKTGLPDGFRKLILYSHNTILVLHCLEENFRNHGHEMELKEHVRNELPLKSLLKAILKKTSYKCLLCQSLDFLCYSIVSYFFTCKQFCKKKLKDFKLN